MTEILYDTKYRPILLTQHPNADLDYVVDFSVILDKFADGDTISSFTITSTRGITIYSTGNDDYAVQFWAKDGSAGNSYIIVVEIVTVNGRTIPFELVLPVGYTQQVLNTYS